MIHYFLAKCYSRLRVYPTLPMQYCGVLAITRPALRLVLKLDLTSDQPTFLLVDM